MEKNYSPFKNSNFRKTAIAVKVMLLSAVLLIYAGTGFAQAPVITAFSPASGAIGSSVSITGTNFNSISSQNIVFFGATQATVTGGSTTMLTVTVPVGATYQYISVTNLASGNNLTAYSAQPFIVTLAGNILFKPTVNFTTGTNPQSVGIGDIDGDGKPDLAVANSNSNNVSIFRNTSVSGTVSFATQIDSTTGISPRSVSIGDIDGDGKPDLVVANGMSNTVSVFRNTSTSGTISFAAKVDFTTGVLPISVSIGDIDGDGKPDLAVADNSSVTVSVLRNLSTIGVISFTAKVDFATSTYPISVSIGDIDGDGKPDLVMANNSSNTVSVLLSMSYIGMINFATKVDFTTGTQPCSVSIGDIDGDGKPDLAVANQSSSTVSILRNLSTGSGSVSFATNLDFTTGTSPYSISIGDIDGDGKPDLATANYSSNTASVLRNVSTSGNVSFAAKVDFATGTYPQSISIGDIDGDGKPDLCLPNNGSNSVSVLRQTIPPPATPGVITGTNPQCPGVIAQTYSITAVSTATSYTWTIPPGWSITSGQGTISIIVTTGNTPGLSNITVTASNDGGISAADSLAVIVNPNNVAGAASSTPTVCIGSVITNIMHLTNGATGIGSATGLPAGVTAAWSANTITISGTPTSSGTFNYSIPLTGGCGNVNATGTITVNPNNTVGAASSTPTLCINTALVNITHTTTGATGIGPAAGLPPGVNAAWVSNIITISGTPTAAGTFNYIIPLMGGCGSVHAQGTITVTPSNTASAASSTPTLCINTALTNITHATTGALGIGPATGLPAGVNAAWGWPSDTITISGTPTATGTFNYSIPLTGGCGNVSATGTVTVNPNNTAGVASSTPTLCINTALTNITHATTGAAGIGSATGLPAGVTAAWAANTITISGTPTASGTFSYNIPLTGGCGNINATGIITVTPDNTAGAASSTPTLCINTALTNITHATTGAAGIGSATGLPAGVIAAWAANTITISGTTTASSTFSYNIPLTGGCGNINATGIITVTPDNTAGAASSTPTLCINTALTNITHATTGATGIGSATGLPAGVTAAWAANTITISGTPTASGTFSYSIPLTGGCGNVNATGMITVTTANTAGAASSTPILCINTALTNITHATTGATGIGSATGLPAGVTAAWAANTITISGTPTSSGTFNYSIPLTGGCGSVNATGTITVNPLPIIGATATPSQTICAGTMVILSGTGANTYIWTSGVNDGIGFVPTATATYMITGTDGNGCSGLSTITITLNPAPIANAGPDQTACFGDTATLSGTGGISYLWTDGTNSYTTSTIQESLDTTTSYALTVSDNMGCTASDTALIMVVPSTDIYGHVVYSGGNVINGSVVIYHYRPFQTLFDTVQVAPLNSSGDYHFTSINHGNYLIKVFSDTATYHTLVASYYGNASLWNDSSVIEIIHNCTSSDTLNTITMIEQIGIGGGPGFITGQVIEGPSFGRNLGDPIPGVDVDLGKNPGGSIMNTTTTDSTGNYTFSGVPDGNYTIYVDIPGLGRDSSYTFSVDSSNNQFLHLDYIADSNSVYINPNSTVGIGSSVITDKHIFKVYPNPVIGATTIEYNILQLKEAKIKLEVYNILGVKIRTLVDAIQTTGNYKYNFNPQYDNLNSGVYFITLTIDGKANTERIVIME